MSDAELEQLSAREAELFKRLKDLEAPYIAARSEWSNVYDALKESEMERKIEARLKDKLQAERREERL